tara:strand:- start:3000 stop:3356 length:357 start_codon:yes stop_codon:yes gene_type:complete
MASQKYKVWYSDDTSKIFEFNDDYVNLKRIRELIGERCRIAQGLPGTEYNMWCDEECKLYNDWQENINMEATQQWQDSAAHHMGWEWLMDHYGGFIWNMDVAVGTIVEVLEGDWEDDE